MKDEQTQPSVQEANMLILLLTAPLSGRICLIELNAAG